MGVLGLYINNKSDGGCDCFVPAKFNIFSWDFLLGSQRPQFWWRRFLSVGDIGTVCFDIIYCGHDEKKGRELYVIASDQILETEPIDTFCIPAEVLEKIYPCY